MIVSLEEARAKLRQSIDECLALIRVVHSLDSDSGSPKTLSKEQLDLISGWAFVRIHAAWEDFTETSFLAYMLGAHGTSGFVPSRYVFPLDEQHALNMILGGRDYVQWTTPSVIRRQSLVCFEGGLPFLPILDSLIGELQEVNTIRNAIVHQSTSALEKFQSLVRSKLGSLPKDINPAGFLLSPKPPTRGRTNFSYYSARITTFANGVVSG